MHPQPEVSRPKSHMDKAMLNCIPALACTPAGLRRDIPHAIPALTCQDHGCKSSAAIVCVADTAQVLFHHLLAADLVAAADNASIREGDVACPHQIGQIGLSQRGSKTLPRRAWYTVTSDTVHTGNRHTVHRWALHTVTQGWPGMGSAHSRKGMNTVIRK